MKGAFRTLNDLNAPFKASRMSLTRLSWHGANADGCAGSPRPNPQGFGKVELVLVTAAISSPRPVDTAAMKGAFKTPTLP